jgi:ribonuclease Z
VKVTLLGCGVPTPAISRFGSGYLLEMDDEKILVDCGPATTYKLTQVAVPATAIGRLFFTHHHFDHNADYPCFVLTRYDQSVDPEQNILEVLGPQPTSRITTRLFDSVEGAYSYDWKARVGASPSQAVFVNRGGSLPRPSLKVNAVDIEAGFTYDGASWRVSAARARHVQPFLESLAYRFEAGGHSVVFTGDTEPCEAIIELARDADVLVCMCWDRQGLMEADGEHLGQCGTTGAGHIAAHASARKLVLTHLGPRLTIPDVLVEGLQDVKDVYDGPVVVGNELSVIEVSGAHSPGSA